jgi:prepilin-type N-terminal cleavage/methylation domain-containing protein
MRNGFTLIELSIVLVIIGLVVSGILFGRDLIHTAELRAQISDIEKFQTAAHVFRDKYKAYPGDIDNATDFWPERADCASMTIITEDYARTCDGDGDGYIDEAGIIFEGLFFWQQLGLAKLTTPYGGASYLDGGAIFFKTPMSGPKSRVTETSIVLPVFMRGWPYERSPALVMGAYAYSMFGIINKKMKPIDLYYFDSKMDDGKPGTGRVFAGLEGDWHGDTVLDSNCVNFTGSGSHPGGVPYTDLQTTTYNLQSNVLACEFYMKSGFAE